MALAKEIEEARKVALMARDRQRKQAAALLRDQGNPTASIAPTPGRSPGVNARRKKI